MQVARPGLAFLTALTPTLSVQALGAMAAVGNERSSGNTARILLVLKCYKALFI